jgi:DNA-binding NtrC family response regulator
MGVTRIFQSYHWPGNVRELQNVIERCVILCEGGVFAVDANWLSREPLQPNPPSRSPAGKLVDRQKETIEAALAESKGRVTRP